jgi:predicted amidophosphoribosyltransferase
VPAARHPFGYDLGAGALSAEAIAAAARCRAVPFDAVARRLVHGLKYRDRGELARWMGNGWRGPAPTLWRTPTSSSRCRSRVRLWTRRFNQLAALGQAIARSADRRFGPAVLRRVRATAQQVGLSATERDENVRSAFRVDPEERPAIAGRRVLLVDDVYTTGATVKAATRALLRGGAAAVDVVVFARVVRGGD